MGRVTVHLEGMGWLGSVIAHHLAAEGIEFTWHDHDGPSAWKASTGQVYPAGDDRSIADAETWRGWAADPPWPWRDLTEEAEYWFTHRAPPHGAPGPIAADVGWARRTDATALQVDVAGLVVRTRQLFAARRTDVAQHRADRYVVAHGFGDRAGGFVWGWSAPAHIEWPQQLIDASRHRPSLVVHEHRFSNGYAYPAAGTDHWWAGSAMIRQLHPKDRYGGHAGEWSRWMESRVPVRVTSIGPERQGWRPVPYRDDQAPDHVTAGDRTEVPPLGPNGVRWAPTVAAEVLAAVTG